MPRQQAVEHKIAGRYFHEYLWEFYRSNKKEIRKQKGSGGAYEALTIKFLNYNDPDENPKAYLRRPQFEALEMYVFLKECLHNLHIQHIFENWYKKEGQFSNRKEIITGDLFETQDERAFKEIYKQMQKEDQDLYPSYLFALTMGLGKTTLMAVCIFYEFILANKYGKNKYYCHNVLVLAPDKTVLESLKEIQTLDKSLIVPPGHVGLLETHLKFHVLDGDGSLNLLAGSKFNIIIANNQKVILKTKRKATSQADTLFKNTANIYESKEAEARKLLEAKESKKDSPRKRGSAADELSESVDPQALKDETQVINNSRFVQLSRLEQLGIFVDEAHHLFGRDAAKDKKALKKTVDELASNLAIRGTHLVGSFNFSGTPYLEGNVLPQVVYEFGLKKSINEGYLKKAAIKSFENAKSKEIVKAAISEFWEKHGGKTYEGLRPKMAIYAPNIKDLTHELKPIVEDVLIELGIPTDRILVNVGDDKQTTNDDIQEFNRLDTPSSQKQFILLVNKGKEGWNCRSLFSVVLYRKPDAKNKIFVLQATMRCLRQIGSTQETGLIYLDKENEHTLEEQLAENFHMSLSDLKGKEDPLKKQYQIHVKKPIKSVKFKRKLTKFEVSEKEVREGYSFSFEDIDLSAYQIKVTTSELGKVQKKKREEDLTDIKEKRVYSKITLVAEIAKYLNKPCLEVKKIIHQSKEGVSGILELINEYNEVLFDRVIPHLFGELYDIRSYSYEEEYEVDLVKDPGEGGSYQMKAKPELTVEEIAVEEELQTKSFHLDTYCFDSEPEKEYFWNTLRRNDVKEIFFTGMLTHGQSDFVVNYYDPESDTIRSYYPDFIVELEDGSVEIIEVKGDHKIDDPTVQAKKAATEAMLIDKMKYRMLRSSDLTEVGGDGSQLKINQ